MFRVLILMASSTVSLFAISCEQKSKPPLPVSPQQSERALPSIDRKRFWAVVEASAQRENVNREQQLKALHTQLEALAPNEIVSFQTILSNLIVESYSWDLWGAAYVIAEGCSDDEFLDFRSWLISKGQKVYEDALGDPETLSAVITQADGDCQFEEFQYIAGQVWSEKTGKHINLFPLLGPKQPDSPTGQAWSEDGDDLMHRFPKLWKRVRSGQIR